jgi:hypothetical protein
MQEVNTANISARQYNHKDQVAGPDSTKQNLSILSKKHSHSMPDQFDHAQTFIPAWKRKQFHEQELLRNKYRVAGKYPHRERNFYFLSGTTESCMSTASECSEHTETFSCLSEQEVSQ